MKHRISMLLAIFGLCACLAGLGLPGRAAAENPADSALRPAPSQAVTLYPQAGRLFVVQTLPVKDGMIQLALPANTKRESLRLQVEGREIQRLEMATLERAAVNTPEAAALRAEYARAQAEERQLKGRLAAAQARLKLWTTPEARLTQAAEFERLDALIADRLSRLHVEAAELEELAERAGKERERLETAVLEAGYPEETPLLVSAGLSPADPGTVEVSLNYLLPGCGWNSAYRLEALPDSSPAKGAESDKKQASVGLVRFEHIAEIQQASGRDWKNVRLTLASGDPGAALAPQGNRPWRMEQASPWLAPPRTKGGPSPKRDLGDEDLELSEAFEEGPVVREQSTFTAWDLGRRNVPAGAPSTFSLMKEEWPADFTRLIRPAVDSRAYLMATVNLPDPRHLPEGRALVFADGELVGSNLFGLTGDQADIFFGTDPRVNAKMNLEVDRTGRRGVVDRRRSRVWDWRIEVTNAHARPVTVRVEDPQPQSGDEAIKLEVSSSPAPQVEDQVYVWKLDVPANGKTMLKHKVTMSAPADMAVDSGR